MFHLDVFLPQIIRGRLSNGDHHSWFLDSEFHIKYHNSTSLAESSPFGFIQLPRDAISTVAKVSISNCRTGVAMGPAGAG